MARYRHAHRSALLNLTVVGLAAATATLWIARPVLPSPEAIALRLHPISQPAHRASGPRPAGVAAPSNSPALVAASSTATAAATETATPVATPTATAEATETATPAATPPAAAQDAAPSPEPAEAAPAADSQSATDQSADTESQAAPEQPAAPESAIAPVPPPPPAPRYVRAQAAQTAYLRTDPTVAALIVGSLPPGSVVGVVGCANGCNWLLVTLPGGGEAWSESYFYNVLGSLSGL